MKIKAKIMNSILYCEIFFKSQLWWIKTQIKYHNWHIKPNLWDGNLNMR